nr:hypothetical protein B0A51_03314 [Rachicladosporium sp. CCFEE 5018]
MAISASLTLSTKHQIFGEFRSSASSQPPTQKRYARPSINAFDESFAAALNPAKQPSDILNTPDAVLVQQAVKSGAPNPARPRTVSLVGSKVLLQSKAAPSLAICTWNEVSHTSEYTRPAVDLLKEVLEVRYPALCSPGSEA